MVKAMVFLVVTYGCDIWTIKKAEAEELIAQIVVWEKALKSRLDSRSWNKSTIRKSILNIHRKDWRWGWSRNTLVSVCAEPTHWQDSDAQKDWKEKEKGVTEGEMVEQLCWLSGDEFEETPGVDEG